MAAPYEIVVRFDDDATRDTTLRFLTCAELQACLTGMFYGLDASDATIVEASHKAIAEYLDELPYDISHD